MENDVIIERYAVMLGYVVRQAMFDYLTRGYSANDGYNDRKQRRVYESARRFLFGDRQLERFFERYELDISAGYIRSQIRRFEEHEAQRLRGESLERVLGLGD